MSSPSFSPHPLSPGEVQQFRSKVTEAERRIQGLAAPPGVIRPFAPALQPRLAAASRELASMVELLRAAETELMQQLETATESQDALAAEWHRYRQLFEAVPEPYLITDAYGMVLEANPAASRLFGIPSKRLIRRPLASLIASEDRSSFRDALTTLGRTGDAEVRLEWRGRMQRRDGDPVDATCTIVAARDSASQAISLRWLVRAAPGLSDMHVPTIVATRADASAPQHVVAHDERSEAPAVTAEPALGELAALRRNALLARFPDASLRRVAGEATVVQLSAGQTLEVGESVGGNAFFPLTAVLTLTVPGDGREEVKLGAVGSGGVVGLSEPDLLIVRAMTSGTVLRVPKERIATEVANSSSVATLLDRYAKARAAELARESLCNLHHRLERRLARWLITLDELTEGRPFTATHESMARMLGVRRAGVTAAAVDMARDGLIAYHRGSISVLDRERLASLACSCHTLVQSTYEAALRG